MLTAAARGAGDVPSRVAAVASEHRARIVASLIRSCGGDFQLAEDALQEAFVTALERWSRDGVPDRPDAWLLTAARHHALDQLRRRQTFARKREELERLVAHEQRSEQDTGSTETMDDDRLRLIFTCCHPALALEAQVALTLRTVAGLEVPQIAHAFLVPPDTMAKRLTRARTKIRDAGIPYRVPDEHELPDRLNSVLTVIYLVFNEGYLGTGAPSLVRAELCDEAIRLARVLLALMPDEPEVRAVLALLLLVDSRRLARTDVHGELRTLEEQDRELWNRHEIAEGLALVETALRLRRPGRFQLQAAIAALHAESAHASDTDWRQIVLLYDQLFRIQPTPVVELNRAAAIGMAFGSRQGLRLVDALDARGVLSEYHLLPATRADLLRRDGEFDAAAAAYRQAIGLCGNDVELRYLRRRLSEVTAEAASP